VPIPTSLAATRLVVTPVHLPGHQIPAQAGECLEQFLAKPRGILHLKGLIVVLEDAMGRSPALLIFDQQAVGGQL
jgi:hypothetical protein